MPDNCNRPEIPVDRDPPAAGPAAAGPASGRAPAARLPVRRFPVGRLPVGPEGLAAVLSVAWVALASVWLLMTPDDGSGTAGGFVVTALAVVLPVALIWVAASAARTARILHDELQRLQAALEQTRAAILGDRQVARLAAPAVAQKPAGTAPPARAPEAPQGTFSTTREPPRPPRPGNPQAARPAEEQPLLALGAAPDEGAPPLARADLIRALNFPDTDKDAEGFAALRRALRDRRTRQLIQASQDVLTLLSQDGIYMDDLTPDRARPEVWRRFARGERGRSVAALGGVRDRSCLARTTGRMRQDTIFRDAAHHFLRLFDRMLAAAEAEFSDEDIARLSDTRTARAFMLIGRVTGAFD